MKRSLRITLIVIIPIVLAAAYFILNHTSQSSEPQAKESQKKGGERALPVSIYIADYLHIEEGIASIGNLLPNEEVIITSEIAGKVEKIYFEEGTRVKKGSILVKINDDDLQAQLKRANFQYDLLKERLSRNRILLEKDAISREAFDQIETDFNIIQSDIQLLEVRIDKTEIKAPFDGTIGVRYISPGSYLQPNTQVARLVDYSKLKLEFAIQERHYKSSLKGTNVVFSTESDRTPRYAKIYAVDSKVDNNTRTITMRALYNNNKGITLMPGMFARVAVGQKIGSSIQVPTEAIVLEANRKLVWTVRNNRAVSVIVETGIRGDKTIEITNGLNAGDSVVITGLMQIRESALLQISVPQ